MTQQASIPEAIELARNHFAAGRLPQAEAIARRVLAAEPNHPDALHLMASIAFGVGRVDVAIDLLRRVISLAPATPGLLNDLGNALVSARRFDQAIAAFQQAITLEPVGAGLYYNLGNAMRDNGQIDQAIAAFREAIKHRPQYPNALNNLGNLLLDRCEYEESIESLGKAVELAPEMTTARYNLARALHDSGKVDESVALLRQVLAANPDYAEALNNLGVILEERSELEEAQAVLEKAIALRPDWAVAHYNLGNVQRATGQFQAALRSYERALSIDPQYSMALCNLGMTHLLLGEWTQGWPGYEHRWSGMDMPQPVFACPRWRGQPLNGRRILIHAEQGFGDTLNFVRFVPLVAAAGGRVIFTCPAEMHRLLENFPGVETLISDERLLGTEISTYCPLMSVPGVLNITLQNLPASVPYLKADPQLSQQWRRRLPDDRKLKIGIVCAGRSDDRAHKKRAIPRRLFRPIADMKNVTLVSLQKETSPQDEQDPAAAFDLLDWTSELNDFADTAALIDNLDLVITIDSAVAHLAGAMGKPVWTMLVFVPDWRWLLEREDSPWYPTMRLFRQTQIGDWESVMQRVVEALRKFDMG